MNGTPLDEAPEAAGVVEKRRWSRPLVEIVSMDQTLNSGASTTDGSTQQLLS
ncbi:hypothetical protein [Ancylobacter sp. IITR112]|uniref:hypothetical protein n=1 Tax=Ancylobacter sp. IITR112 TaxID=3138073 RepID=UPI00352B51FC